MFWVFYFISINYHGNKGDACSNKKFINKYSKKGWQNIVVFNLYVWANKQQKRKCKIRAIAVFIFIISIPMHFKKLHQTNFANSVLSKNITTTQRVLNDLEDQAFLLSYDFWLLPHPLPPTSVSKLSLFLMLPVSRHAVSLLTGGWGAKSCDGEKAWSSINHPILNTLWTRTSVMMLVTRLFWKSSSDSRSFSSYIYRV